ncbi:MAG: type II toxin-antitoxin system RelE/ParE family toxin [Candidatus Caenarcaniphilales bacterium]|nr:type II toxin-antitoxin system RelE/ParE family toxin [Candidatus Caenarcaniphilales bacterium]
MKLQIENSFVKDIRKYKDKKLWKRIEDIFIQIEETESLSKIPNVKALKVNGHFYRVRIRDYRLGFELIDNCVRILAFGHRNDFYRGFP